MARLMNYDQYKRSLEVDKDCSICLEPYSSDEEHPHLPVRLACGHWFGKPCLQKHIEPPAPESIPSNRCPLCRRVMYEDNRQAEISSDSRGGDQVRRILVSTAGHGVDDIWFLICYDYEKASVVIRALWRIVHRYLRSNPIPNVIRVLWRIVYQYLTSSQTLSSQSQEEYGVRNACWDIIAQDLAADLPDRGETFISRLKERLGHELKNDKSEIFQQFVHLMIAEPERFVLDGFPKSVVLAWLGAADELPEAAVRKWWNVACFELEFNEEGYPYEFFSDVTFEERT